MPGRGCAADERLFLIEAAGRHVELCLRNGNRLTLRLDCKTMLLIVAGGEVAADAGQHFGHAADGRGRIEHRPIHPVARFLKLNLGRRGTG